MKRASRLDALLALSIRAVKSSVACRTTVAGLVENACCGETTVEVSSELGGQRSSDALRA